MRKSELVATVLLLIWQGIYIHAADKIVVQVKIIDQQESSSHYSYWLPGYSNSTSTTTAGCYGGSSSVNCSSETIKTGSKIPARVGGYNVNGATLSLELPDGRVAVVNCASKYAPKGDGVNKRSCRIPLVNDLEVEFNGDNAKLKWPVSIDGKKLQSETYKVLGLLTK